MLLNKNVKQSSEFLEKRTSALRVYLYLLVVILLLINEPSSKLVSCQLEAVGAVLSVVPVTSILATAGLVGVKLAALSRLLQALGYDRAYLAQGGPGTATQPIGLHTNYAYMFPYVPGLNISVKGEHGPAYGSASGGHQAPTNDDAVKVQGTDSNRKIYPAMGLPGDYEKQARPFRGSETLREIFRDAGIQMHLPTQQQQQQILQQFHLPPQGNGQLDRQQQQTSSSSSSDTTSSISISSSSSSSSGSSSSSSNRDNDKSQPIQQPSHATAPTDQQHFNHQPAPSLANQNFAPPVPSNVSPPQSHHHPVAPELPQSGHQPASTQSSSSSPAAPEQPGPRPASDSPTSHQQPNRGPKSSAAQVNMPHPHYNQHLPLGLFVSASPPLSSASPFLPTPSSPLELFSQPPDHHRLHPQAPTLFRRPIENFLAHVPIPQHDEFRRRIAAQARRQQAQSQDETGASVGQLIGRPADPLPTGQLFQPPAEPGLLPARPLQTFEDYDKYFFAPSGSARLSSTSAVAQSLRPRPQRPHQPHQPAPTVASQGDGFSSLPNEITTNILPRPFDTDEFPTLSTDDHNEMDRVQPQNRRRKRSPYSATVVALNHHNRHHHYDDHPPLERPASQTGKLAAAGQQQPVDSRKESRQTYGMPALNIHAVRKKKRQSGLGDLARAR